MVACAQARDHALITAAAHEDLQAKRNAIGEDETDDGSEDDEEEEMDEDMENEDGIAGAQCISDGVEQGDEKGMEFEFQIAGTQRISVVHSTIVHVMQRCQGNCGLWLNACPPTCWKTLRTCLLLCMHRQVCAVSLAMIYWGCHIRL